MRRAAPASTFVTRNVSVRPRAMPAEGIEAATGDVIGRFVVGRATRFHPGTDAYTHEVVGKAVLSARFEATRSSFEPARQYRAGPPTVGDPSDMTTTEKTDVAPRRPRATVDAVKPSTRSAYHDRCGGRLQPQVVDRPGATLLSERLALTGQAQRLEDEADALLDGGLP